MDRQGQSADLTAIGVALTGPAIVSLIQAGIDYIQLSFQDIDPASNDRIGAHPGAFIKEASAAARIRGAGCR